MKKIGDFLAQCNDYCNVSLVGVQVLTSRVNLTTEIVSVSFDGRRKELLGRAG